MSKFQGTKKYLMGLPPRPQYGAAPPQGGGVPKRFQKRALAAPSQEGMCLPLVSKLLDCYSALGIDGMQEEDACVEERLEVIECQKKEVKRNPVRNYSFLINEHKNFFFRRIPHLQKYLVHARKSEKYQFKEGLRLFRYEPKNGRYII